MKRCTRCEEVKALDCFHKNKSEKDGLNRWCKECFNNYIRQNRHIRKKYNKNATEKISKSYVASKLKIPVSALTDEMYAFKKNQIIELRLEMDFRKNLDFLGLKLCPHCKTIRPINCFYKNKLTKSGLSGHCVECYKECTKKDVEKISARYVVSRLGIKASELTEDLYQMKKQQLEVSRLIKQLNKEIDHGN